jgi:hypothetical protein
VQYGDRDGEDHGEGWYEGDGGVGVKKGTCKGDVGCEGACGCESEGHGEVDVTW